MRSVMMILNGSGSRGAFIMKMSSLRQPLVSSGGTYAFGRGFDGLFHRRRGSGAARLAREPVRWQHLRTIGCKIPESIRQPRQWVDLNVRGHRFPTLDERLGIRI